MSYLSSKADLKATTDQLDPLRMADWQIAEAAEKKTLWFLQAPTKLQSAKLLNAKPLNLPSFIHKFIDLRVGRSTGRATAWVEHATPK